MHIFHIKLPLKTAWYAIIALASILPALVLSIWLSGQAHDLLLESAMLKEDIYHTQLSTRLSLEAERLETVLYNKSDPIAYFLQQKNILAIQALIQKIGIREPMVNTTTLYDTNTKVITSAIHNHHSIAVLNQHSPSFVIPMHQRTFLGSPQKLQDGDYEFVISVPIIMQTKVIAVMVSTINIHAFWQPIMFSTHTHASNIYLLNGRGSLIHAEPRSLHSQGDLLSDHAIVRDLLANKPWNKHKSFLGFENTQVFAISSLVPGLEWEIISEIPASSISKPIFHKLTILTLIIFILHILFAVIGIFLTKPLLDSITDLVVIMKGAAKGDYTQQAQPSRYQELDLLTSSFNIMMHDIDVREKTLKRMYHAIDHAGESIMITNNHGIIEYVNASFCQMSAYSKDEALGKTPGFLSNSSVQSTPFYQQMWAKVKAGEKWEGELVNRRKDGSLYPVFMNISPIFDDGVLSHYIAIQKDVSEQHALEEDLRQAQKMESIGVLVGGIAHDFNNILAGITGNMYLAKKRIYQHRLNESIQKISHIESLSQQAAGMISQLLAFARKDIVKMHTLSLQDFLDHALKLVRVSIPENIQLLDEISKEHLMIRGDTSQLQQVLLNLLNNARDAVENSLEPLIHLKLGKYMPNSAFIRSFPEAKDKEFAHLTITDNGYGISQKHIDKLFDPFFTTKEVGKGTGLGLSMVYGAIQSHQGIIQVNSDMESGTSFHLYFPLVDEKEEEPVEILEALEAHGEIILLADDETYVRDIMSEVLESLGYKMILAKDGLQAKALFSEHQHDISLVILDAVMPHGGGFDLAQAMRTLNPTLPVIFVTGYDKSQVLGSHQQIKGSKILSKPVDFEKLGQHIQTMLKANRQPEGRW
ncbi:MAG: response regulator [Mariprofundaceae bacterium]|nr:response regulator [Mariprofundaceae bacterium]